MLPVGLFGELMNMILVRSSMASLTAGTSISKEPSRGTSLVFAPATLAQKPYMPKVGSQSSTVSPGEMKRRSSRSISSSLPAPAMMCLWSNPV